jgi:hypothetical protein
MIGLLVRYHLSVRKFNRDPEQHELARLFIGYADGHKPWQAVFEFLERQWLQSRDSRELRITARFPWSKCSATTCIGRHPNLVA